MTILITHVIIRCIIRTFFFSGDRGLAICLFSCFVMFCSLPASSQMTESVKHYSTEQGLSHDGVLCITRDREGFMWFGTWDGLNKFDGHTFSVYKSYPGDSSSLTNNKFRNIVEDSNGFLWVKTYDHNVYRFDKNTGKFLAISRRSGMRDIIADRIHPMSDGSTWLTTTHAGLLHVVFDKAKKEPETRHYTKSGSGNFKLPSDSINFFFEDNQKNVWAGTKAGLVRIDPKGKTKVFSRHLSLTCAVQHGNTIYFGSRDGKLISHEIASGKFFSRELSAGNRINAIHVSKHRNLYAATLGSGLINLDLASGKTIISRSPVFHSLFSIFEDRGGRLWFESDAPGIVKYDPQTNTFKRFAQKKDSYATSPSNNYMVFEDFKGKLWTRLKGGGFGYYNAAEDRLDYFHNEPGVSNHKFSNIVTALYPDSTGILWLATIDGGLNKITFSGDNFSQKLMVNNPVNKSQNEVRLLFEDSKRRLWVGTKAGDLAVYKDGVRQQGIFNINPEEIGKVYAIMEDKQGVFWIGTKGGGLLTASPLDAKANRYTLKRFLPEPGNPNSIGHNTIYSILQDRKGRIWLGTFGAGLSEVIKTESGISFKNTKSLFHNYPSECNYIRHLCEDPSGKLWIATTNGLVIANKDRLIGGKDAYRVFKKIPGDPSSLGNNEVQFVFKDKAGSMWVGTFGGGLNKLLSDIRSDEKKFRSYTREDGLPNDIILSIAEDTRGHLWVATGKGLARFDARSERFKTYDSHDGLGLKAFSEAAAFRSFDGTMFFGGTEGYISFDPRKLHNRKIRAEMVLTNIQLYNNDVVPGAVGSPLASSLNSTSHLVLDYDQSVVSIEYALLDYRAAHKSNYAYVLRGYDKDWHYVRDQRKATYTNLPPGDYEFVVKSLNNDMFSNIPQKSIRLTILPPPWLSWWAYLAYFLLLIGLVEMARRIAFAIIRLRNKVTIEQKLTELKLQFFTNISHELRTPLTLIVNPLDELSRNEGISEQSKQYISTARRNAGRMVRFVNQLLDFRKVQSGKMNLNVTETEVLGLLHEVAGYFDGLAREKNIDFKLELNARELFAWVDPEKLDIVIYNLLSNAFKFSPNGTTITLSLINKPETGNFDILISDQGPGVPPGKLHEIFDLYYEGGQATSNLKGTGIGLALSAELIRAHKGEIFAENNKDSGMTFTLRLRSGKDHFSENELNFASSGGQHLPAEARIQDLDAVETFEPVIPDHDGEMPLVLLVEDNSELRTFMAGQLLPFYRVKEAGDGAEGLIIAEQCLPDLIISDVMMPGIDGIQMLDQLKNNESTSHIPVILLTAKSSIGNQIEGLKYGADFYITKPFNMHYLMALVENFFRRRAKQVEALQETDKKIVCLKPDEILITSRDEDFVRQVIRIVETSMEDSDFNIESVAESAGFGRTTFYKKLKSLTGLAPVEFVREMRLKRSKQLMDAGGYTISEIAYMTGFKSAGYFSTCFKEKFKQSPSAYLKSLKAESSD